jgi:hypothetical protein
VSESTRCLRQPLEWSSPPAKVVLHGPPVENRLSRDQGLGAPRSPRQLRRLRETMARFPTGCAGPWKTLVLIRRCPGYDDRRAKPSSTDNNDEFPTALVSRPRRTATTTGGTLLLSKFRTEGGSSATRSQVYFGNYSIQSDGSYADQDAKK